METIMDMTDKNLQKLVHERRITELNTQEEAYGFMKEVTPQPQPRIEDTLKERSSRYGDFSTRAQITQNLKLEMYRNSGWHNLSPSMKEALEMIQHKIGRILNGDPMYKDSWIDIEGYAHLVSEKLK
jgi:hypothetical protein